ncbi:MAG: hypothetical protein KUL81_14160, partial [Azonexus sp.]|nr:hypothetical protein [Azonexus sp.]
LTVDFSTSTDCSAFVTSAFALIPFATEVAFASRHPHLSVVQFVKDQRCAVSFDSSAAEKRDYEALPTSRQAISKSFLQQLETSCPSTSPENPVAAEEVRII